MSENLTAAPIVDAVAEQWRMNAVTVYEIETGQSYRELDPHSRQDRLNAALSQAAISQRSLQEYFSLKS